MYFFFLLGFGLMNFQSSVSNDMLLHLVKWYEIFGEKKTLFVQLGTYRTYYNVRIFSIK